MTPRDRKGASGPADGAIDGLRLRSLMVAGSDALEANRETIDALNVFPVPDGDTGTNMVLTMRSVLEETGVEDHRAACDTAAAMARSALLGARGNSGLILAQFFKGLVGGLGASPTLGAGHLAAGLRMASENAYASVLDPREGTMLTVFREAADAASAQAAKSDDVTAVWEAATEQARDTVARTPTMLDVLREAGVVDSGGYGVSVLLEGALRCLRGETDGTGSIEPPRAIGVEPGAPGTIVRREFLASAEEEVWGYCTVFAIEGEDLDPIAIRSRMSELGKSAVVGGGDSVVKIHIHTEDPGPALSYGTTLGTLSRIAILNMDEQMKDWAEERRSEQPQIDLAIVAVISGDGLGSLFLNAGLGACSVVPGGDTMNPSTADLLEAVKRAPSNDVVLLPNNKNVVGTALQVPDLTEKKVSVVPTTDVPSGVAALLAYSPALDRDANVKAMTEAAASIRSGAICRASRDTSLHGKKVELGQVIGVLDDRLVSVGDDVTGVLVDMLATGGADGCLVTLYAGIAVSEEDAQAAAARIGQSVREAEIEVVKGGQPHYDYFVAIE